MFDKVVIFYFFYYRYHISHTLKTYPKTKKGK
jgi:hypothetical protein